MSSFTFVATAAKSPTTNPDKTMPACSEADVNAAIFSQKPLIAHQIKERFQKQRRYMIRRIREGERLDPHDDSRTVILSKALPMTVGYSDYTDPYPDTCDGPALKPGFQPGQDKCNDQCGSVQMATNINETEQGLCDGVCIVDYAQGFRYRGYVDAQVKIATPARCIETLAKRDRKHVLEYIEQEAEFLSESAFLSFDRKLTDLAIKRSGANSVVRSVQFGEPVLTFGGWDPGPTPNDPVNGVRHVTIYWLERYREQIIEALVAASQPDAENYVLEVEMTREAWKFALITESLQRTSDGGIVKGLGEQIRLNANLNINESAFGADSILKGRKFDTWNGKLRVIFNDEPIRGFLRPNGQTTGGVPTYEFIRIADRINIPDEEAGLRTVPNQDYRRNCITCYGLEHPLLELIPNIHATSFIRHNLTQGLGPAGVNPIGTNFEIQLLKDGYLSSKECPNWGNKNYRYYMEHKFRWRDIRPEFSGFILHRRLIMKGYDLETETDCLFVNDGNATAAPADCNACDEERCCPLPAPECTETDNKTSLVPCGDVATSWYGEDRTIALQLCRDAFCADHCGCVAQVNYQLTDGTAEYGTHYVVVDEAGVELPASGVVSWENGEHGCKKVFIKIMDALPDTDPDDSDCCGEGPTPNPATFTFSALNSTGTTLTDCTNVEVSIWNRSE